VELEEADACCGSAGVYNLLQPGLAGRILERKVDAIRAAAVARVVTANPGCLLQLRAGLAEAGVDVEVVGLAQVLAEAYAPEAAADG
jgi:glycolate oxidase iron-sulfur subunit